MDPIEMIELFDCPICGGPGVMFDEGGWALNVQCCDCGAHTVYVEYNNDAEKQEAERRAREEKREREKREREEERLRVVADDIRRLNKKLASYKRINKISVVLTEFEKTTTRKIKRNAPDNLNEEE